MELKFTLEKKKKSITDNRYKTTGFLRNVSWFTHVIQERKAIHNLVRHACDSRPIELWLKFLKLCNRPYYSKAARDGQQISSDMLKKGEGRHNTGIFSLVF